MALALRLAAYLSCTGLPMGLPFPRQGDFPPGHVFPLIWATATVVALLFGLRYDPAARFPSWRCFLSFGPRRTRGPHSVACGAAEHAAVHSVGRMTVAIGGAKARRSAALEPCAASRCRM